MAEKKKFPYKVKNHKTGRERTVFGPADLVAANFDGYTDGPKPKAFTDASRKAVKERAQASANAASQPQDAAGDAGKSTTTPADKPATTK